MAHDDGIRVSIIIPTYNSEETIGPCLSALQTDSVDAKEIIVVDDGSTDETQDIVTGFGCRLISFEENSGPAFARNVGAAAARGEILFFVDSDLILIDDAVSMVAEFYRDNPDADSMIGMYAKRPANEGWFHYYLALWRYFSWTHPIPSEFSFFIASCGTIRKSAFVELGGFDTTYRGAEVEDYEFGHRLAKDKPILLLPGLQGFHFFPGFLQCMKNYFHRSRKWFELFVKRKRFDSGQAKASNGFSVVFAVACVVSLVSVVVVSHPVVYWSSILFLVAYLLTIRGFLMMAFQERGLLFGLYVGFVHLALSLAVMSGVAAALVQLPLKKER